MRDREYTHPDVLTIGVEQGWAERETNPELINWVPRLAKAAIPFRLENGRPKNPFGPTGIRYGRGELGHWGEGRAADAVVFARRRGFLWLAMVERGDGYGWALPGGFIDGDETPLEAAVREYGEETGGDLTGVEAKVLGARYVPDPRATDEAWMVTTPVRFDLGLVTELPPLVGADDAKRAMWVRALSYERLAGHLEMHGGKVFLAHRPLLAEILG